MNPIPYAEAALFENRFWMQIMGDHARFLFFTLAPSETEYIVTAQRFILLFDELLEKSYQTLSEYELSDLLSSAYQITNLFREFKLELLAMSVNSDLKSQLSPSFYNDMLNELEAYLQILLELQKGNTQLMHPLHYHILWLSDAAGHAAFLADTFDFTEKDLIDRSYRFEMQFQDFYLKALMMNGFLRAQLSSFPALSRFHDQVSSSITSFIEFLDTIRDQRTDHKILGTLMPLMADHMSREGCYYLYKLSQSTGTVKRPDCDPFRSRVSD
jgi:hypothetical protein